MGWVIGGGVLLLIFLLSRGSRGAVTVQLPPGPQLSPGATQAEMAQVIADHNSIPMIETVPQDEPQATTGPGPTFTPPPAPTAIPEATVPLPEGYNPTYARRIARTTATAIVQWRGQNPSTDPTNYEAMHADPGMRTVIRRFQRAAGLAQDGRYGSRTAGALQYFGATAPRTAGGAIRYVPPEQRGGPVTTQA